MEKTFSKLIELISEKIFAKELDSNELTEISNFCSSASKFKFNKDFDGFTKFKQVYVENAKIFARIPTKDGQDAITLFNQQMFSNYRRIFILTPKIIDFLLKESSNIIEVYFLQREFDMLRLDIAYKNTSDNIYYFMEGEPMIPMNDFTHRQEEFESEVGLQRILDNGLNPNKFGCPKRLEIDKKDLKEFLEFKKDKINPTVELVTGIHVKGNANLNQRFTLVMRFVHENVNGDTVYGNYYDTYHLCPPGSCVITS